MSEDLSFFLDWADQYLNFEKTPKKNIFWLETMKFICSKLGDPQNSCPSFHVAGSKGKGSVSAILANIISKKGLSVGLYSSPHILDFRERITLNRKFFSADIYRQSARELMSMIESIKRDEFPEERPLTWFELVTALSMLCFKNAKTDAAVYEVGLGGRLDSTNIIIPDLSIITPIELEHTEFLGDTLEKIAYEKAGIIKENVPVVIQKQFSESVKDVFRKVAAEKNAPAYFLDEIASISKEKYYISSKGNFKMKGTIQSSLFRRPLKVKMHLTGRMQLENAALAAVAAKISFPDMDESIIEKGINTTKLPARFEVIRSPAGNPDIPFMVLDGAHTVKSMNYTVKNLKTVMELYNLRRAVLLFACAEDKDVCGMSQSFDNTFTDVIVTRPGDVKKTDLNKISRAFNQEGISHIIVEDYNEAFLNVLKIAENKKACILTAGSFYLVSEVKKYLNSLT